MQIIVQTDWDFGIRFNGRDYCDYEFTIQFDSVEQLDEMELLGPFGRPGPPHHSSEFLDAVKRIQSDPTVSFDTTGGNRGVCYWPKIT